MSKLKILEETPISMSQLKDELKDIKERDEELSFRAAKVAEQIDSLKIIKPKDAEELFSKIDKLAIPRLKELHIYKIVDLMPGNLTELRNIIQSYSLTISNDNLEKILEIINKKK